MKKTFERLAVLGAVTDVALEPKPGWGKVCDIYEFLHPEIGPCGMAHIRKQVSTAIQEQHAAIPMFLGVHGDPPIRTMTELNRWIALAEEQLPATFELEAEHVEQS